MKTRLLCSIASLLVFGAVSAQAQDSQVKDLGNSKYSITVNDLSLTVDAGAGAKILSFKNGDKEVISQLQRFNAFGSTFWTSPQAEWNWPPVAEYDRNPYEVTTDGKSIVLKGQKSERFGYRITKEISADPSGNAIVVAYTITNESGNTKKVAPWEITRVPGNGVIFFDAPVDEITPAGKLPFVAKYGLSWYQYNESAEQRKINADGKGWLAYCNDGLLLVKKFDDITKDQPAPNEAEVQVYVNEGKTFIELESQGAYTELAPGASLEYTVKWYLVPVSVNAEPSEALVDAVKKLID